MNIRLNKFSYEIDDNGSIVELQIGLTGQNNQGEYVNASVKILDSDLKEGQKLETLSLTDGTELAKQKFANYTAIKSV